MFPDGSLCLDIIQDKWSPVYSVSTILTSIQVRRPPLHAMAPPMPVSLATQRSSNSAHRQALLLFRVSFRLICCALDAFCLLGLQSLLSDPNSASPANPDAAKLLATDKKAYRKKVRACVEKSTL